MGRGLKAWSVIIGAVLATSTSCASPPATIPVPSEAVHPVPRTPRQEESVAPRSSSHDASSSVATSVALSDEFLNMELPSREPYSESTVRATSSIPCEQDQDCDLVASPCDCVCPRLIRARKRPRLHALRPPRQPVPVSGEPMCGHRVRDPRDLVTRRDPRIGSAVEARVGRRLAVL